MIKLELSSKLKVGFRDPNYRINTIFKCLFQIVHGIGHLVL